MFDDDDFCDDKFDDDAAFANTLEWAGENLMGELLRRRATHWPDMNEKVFVTLFDMVRTVFEQWMGPDELRNLWDQIAWRYHEHCKESEPNIEAEDCEKLMQEMLPEWYAIVHEARETQKKQQKQQKQKKRRKK